MCLLIFTKGNLFVKNNLEFYRHFGCDSQITLGSNKPKTNCYFSTLNFAPTYVRVSQFFAYFRNGSKSITAFYNNALAYGFTQ